MPATLKPASPRPRTGAGCAGGLCPCTVVSDRSSISPTVRCCAKAATAAARIWCAARKAGWFSAMRKAALHRQQLDAAGFRFVVGERTGGLSFVAARGRVEALLGYLRSYPPGGADRSAPLTEVAVGSWIKRRAGSRCDFPCRLRFHPRFRPALWRAASSMFGLRIRPSRGARGSRNTAAPQDRWPPGCQS